MFHRLFLVGILLSTSACGVSATTGCCLTRQKVNALKQRTLRQDAARFLRVARQTARRRGATPVTLRPQATRHALPFGTVRLLRTPQGELRVHVATSRGPNPGILIAKQGNHRWLVITAKPITTRTHRVRGCECRTHGGMYREPLTPPVYILPTSDPKQVTVVQAPYHRRVLSVSRKRCPGDIP